MSLLFDSEKFQSHDFSPFLAHWQATQHALCPAPARLHTCGSKYRESLLLCSLTRGEYRGAVSPTQPLHIHQSRRVFPPLRFGFLSRTPETYVERSMLRLERANAATAKSMLPSPLPLRYRKTFMNQNQQAIAKCDARMANYTAEQRTSIEKKFRMFAPPESCLYCDGDGFAERGMGTISDTVCPWCHGSGHRL